MKMNQVQPLSLTLIFALALFGLVFYSANATVYYVSSIGSDSNNGLSWSAARESLQLTINTAISGDQVWVKNGTYTGTFTAKDGVALYGGFSGTETSIAQRNLSVGSTIIDANHSGTAYVVPVKSSRINTLDGFTIKNGRPGFRDIDGGGDVIANCSFTSNEGGGVYIISAKSTVNITNSEFDNNGNYNTNGTVIFGGAYIRCNNLVAKNTKFSANDYFDLETDVVNGLITNCSFSKNTFYCVYALGNNLITNCTFDRNSSGVESPGGITITGCTFTNTGSALMVGDLSPTGNTAPSYIKNNLIVGNPTAIGPFGAYGIDIEGYATLLVIENNTIVNTGSGIYFFIRDWIHGFSPVTINVANNVLYGNTYGITENNPYPVPTTIVSSHNDSFGNTQINYNGYTLDPTDIYVDPKFVNAALGNYQLSPQSPLIDAGDNNYVSPGDLDLLGLPRIIGSHVDIGCYEYKP